MLTTPNWFIDDATSVVEDPIVVFFSRFATGMGWLGDKHFLSLALGVRCWMQCMGAGQDVQKIEKTERLTIQLGTGE